MSYSIRKILWVAVPMVFGFLIAQYLSGTWSSTCTIALFASCGIFVCLVIGKILRRIIYFPAKIIRKVLFRL